MFEKFFAAKPRMTRQEFAYKLLFIMCDKDANSFLKDLNLSEPQKHRYFFSTLIFVFILPHTLATVLERKDLIPLLPDPFGLTWPENPFTREGPVKIGDLVITNEEYEHLASFLEKKYNRKVSVQDVPFYKIDFGSLSAGISGVRYMHQLADFAETIGTFPQDKQHVALICKLGIRLESYICEDFIPNNQSGKNNTGRTVAFGRIAAEYFRRISDVFKTL